MSHQPFDILLFDLGGVLVELGGVPVMRNWTDPTMPIEELWRRWLNSSAVRRFERGGCTATEFAAGMVAEFELPVSPQQFLQAFAAWLRGPYPGAIELLRELAPRFRLGLLTNTNPLHWQRVGEMGLLQWFDYTFASFQTGRLKPDPATFRFVAQTVSVPPGRILFLDDNLGNVEGARSVGMVAEQVEGVQGARRRLEELGIIPGRRDKP